MPTPTYTPLANLTLSASAASVTFSSISQAYRDLIVVVTSSSGASNNLRFWLNGNTTETNYNLVNMYGNGSTATSESFQGSTVDYDVQAGGAEYHMIANIMDYSATDKHKTILTRAGKASRGVAATVVRFASTAAVTSVQIYQFNGSWDTGSTFALYGIAA